MASEGVILEINQLLMECPVPLGRLRQLAIDSPGGLQTSSCRRRVWPKLLGVDRFAAATAWQCAPTAHPAVAHQISLDVSRALHRHEARDALKHGARTQPQRKRHAKTWSGRRAVLQQALEALAGTVARAGAIPRRDGALAMGHHSQEDVELSLQVVHHYYQGMHDVVSVLLLVAGADASTVYQWSSALANHFLRDASAPTFEPLLACLDTVWPLLRCADPPLAAALEASGASATVALAWVITWFAHDVADPVVVERLFDAFLASHPALPLYTAAALILASRSQVLACERDFAEMHTLLVALPRDPALDAAAADRLLARAGRLMRKHPPHTLPFLRGVSEDARRALTTPPVGSRSSGGNAGGSSGSSRDAHPPLLVRRHPPPCVAAAVAAADVQLLEQRRVAIHAAKSPRATNSTPLKASKSARAHRRRARVAGVALNKATTVGPLVWTKGYGPVLASHASALRPLLWAALVAAAAAAAAQQKGFAWLPLLPQWLMGRWALEWA
jgi:hypothetical protein